MLEVEIKLLLESKLVVEIKFLLQIQLVAENKAAKAG